jgi:hypothetical protein
MYVLHITKHHIHACNHACALHGHTHTTTHVCIHLKILFFLTDLLQLHISSNKYKDINDSRNCIISAYNPLRFTRWTINMSLANGRKLVQSTIETSVSLFVIYVFAYSLIILIFWRGYNPNIFICT